MGVYHNLSGDTSLIYQSKLEFPAIMDRANPKLPTLSETRILHFLLMKGQIRGLNQIYPNISGR